MKTVNCEGIEYLSHQSEGNAARWIMPLAQYYCKGSGLDIGYSKKEWQFPGSMGVEPSINPTYDAMNLPCVFNTEMNVDGWDYIFSSHCLEHIKENWMNVLDYWLTKIKVGGILFLYLPHSSQRYWQPRNNRKHIHSFSGDEIGEYLKGLGHQTFVSGVDANHSFTVICEKKVISDKEAQEAFEKIYANESAPKFVAGWANIDAGNDMPSMQEYLQHNNIWPPNDNEFGSNAYHEQKAKDFADSEEKYCRENNIPFVRDGNNFSYNPPSDQEKFGNYLHHINSNEHYDCSKEPNKVKAHYMAEVLNMAQRNDVRLDRAIEAAYEAGRLSK